MAVERDQAEATFRAADPGEAGVDHAHVDLKGGRGGQAPYVACDGGDVAAGGEDDACLPWAEAGCCVVKGLDAALLELGIGLVVVAVVLAGVLALDRAEEHREHALG
jgi:hypothetical protein